MVNQFVDVLPDPGENLAATFRDAMQCLESGDHAEAQARLTGFCEKVVAVSASHRFGTIPAQPAASIVVVSYKDVPGVGPAMAEIAQQARETNSEVILVDNGNQALEAIGRHYLDGGIIVRPPFQTGCSLGRNLGAQFASAEFLVFIDDDGLIEPGFVSSLLGAAQETGAIGVRGRVLPLTEGTPKPTHYDLGDRRVPAMISAEGASLWRRRPFVEADGFHPLLYGHEGHDLCAKLFPFHGPFAFFYEPSAVLRHDYADDPKSRDLKQARYDRNIAFVKSRVPKAWTLHSRVMALGRDGRSSYLAALHRAMPSDPQAPPVSILTTARNGTDWLREYTASWKAQSQTNFQLVFVDDGSTDGTADLVESLWQGDDRLTLVRTPGLGRGAALNTALAHAKHEICLIADVDDLSTSDRIGRTTASFSENPAVDYLSFIAFNEEDLLRIGAPKSPFITDMNVRSLFGMPASFPTFAFRKGRFPRPFDETLRGGVDCRWLQNNLAEAGVAGLLVHLPLVYYRTHEGQITALHNDHQTEIRREIILWSFGRVLGPLSEADREAIDILVMGKPATSAEVARTTVWVAAFLARNQAVGVFDRAALGSALLERCGRLTGTAPSENGGEPVVLEVRSLRLAAEAHIAEGNYKLARRALREALKLMEAREIRWRLLTAHRYGWVRYLTRLRPFEK